MGNQIEKRQSKEPSVALVVKNLLTEKKTDCYLYSGPIEKNYVQAFRDEIRKNNDPAENVLLFLTTFGGDPHAAYRMMRTLRRRYKKISFAVYGECASAGTLAALGADELIFSDDGELGPLDVQFRKQDELFQLSSGLDAFQALNNITTQGFDAFELIFLETLQRGGGNITAKTAMENARALAVGLMTPIAGQIDPMRIGEVFRAINIATAYGGRLSQRNVKSGTIDKLVGSYPDHGFVIDFDEARELFNNVRHPDELELAVATLYEKKVKSPQSKAEFADVGAQIDFFLSQQGRVSDGSLQHKPNSPDVPQPTGSDAEGNASTESDPEDQIRSGPSSGNKADRRRRSNGKGQQPSQFE